MIYHEIVKRMCELYGTRAEPEHEFVYEFFEGSIPLFKLILTQNVSAPNFIVVSFYLELDSTAAIQWYLRIRSLDPGVHLSACYLKDRDGTTYVGEDAYIMRMYMVEQDTIAAYLASNKEPEDIFNNKVKPPKPSPVKTYADYRKAIVAFQGLEKKPGDHEH